MRDSLRLGASLYVPACHHKVAAIANGAQFGWLRSVIFCTEDAVAESDLDAALSNLAGALAGMTDRRRTRRFVRVRNPSILKAVLSMPGADKLDGLVIPKATRHSLDAYWQHLRGTRHLVMPTLETVEAFDEREMRRFRDHLLRDSYRSRVLALRIGGNDLLSLLGIRRPRDVTIYRTPLGGVISRLVTIFRPYGFCLTAPVFEHIDRPDVLAREASEDLEHGLSGKTAIHPNQVSVIESRYMVERRDWDAARRILHSDGPAVFELGGSMCEKYSHRNWAHQVMRRARLYGVTSGEADRPTLSPAVGCNATATVPGDTRVRRRICRP